MQREDNQPEISAQSAELFHLIIENVKDYAIFMADADGRIISWNPGVERLLGYAESEIVGQSIAVIFTPEDIAANAPAREMEAAESAGRSEDKRWHVRRDGSRFWANGLVMPLKNADGTLRGFAKVMRDDTAQKLAEEKLEQTTRRVEDILESINDAFFAIDRDWRFAYVNRQAEILVGSRAEDLLGRVFWEVFPSVLGSPFERMYRRAMDEAVAGTVTDFYPDHKRFYEVSVYPAPNGVTVYFRNVTENALADQTLRRAEERYRALVEATATTVWHASPEGALTFVGDAWTEVSGQSIEEILKWGWLEALHPDDRERTIEIWQNALANKTLYSTEFRILTAKGEYRWFAVSAVPILEPDGTVREWIGINTDITERKQSEASVRESEQKFSALAEGVPQLVWMAEADGFIFWYNRNWYEYTGTKPADMEGWGWQSVHDPELLPQVMKRWQASIETGKRFEMEFPLKGADGVFRWFLTRVNPLRDSENRIIRWFGTNTDVDRQRRLDRRNQFIIEIDEAVRPLETPEEITLTLARLLGEHLGADRCAYAEVEADENHFYIPGDYTRGDTRSIVGQFSMADFGAEVLRRMRENLPYVVRDVNTDSQVTEADLAAYRATDICAVICVPLHKNGRFSACMAVHQKTPRAWLTEEIELVSFVANRFWESIERARVIKSLHESFAREQESRLSAENANRLKDEFLATLSHELRTPLNAILGWSQMLQNNKLGESERAKALSTIERNAKSQSQLIDDILDVSRIITGKMRLDVRAVDLSNVITAAVDAARPAAEAKNIRLQILLDPQAGPISGDPDRLQQVVWNLLSNAVKFTPKGGRVQARLERINSHVEIVVSDTGKGIEAEFLPHVFDRFRQSDGSMTRRHGGLGLGLAIVRQIVELHGGTVSVESDGKEKGATFTVHLPLLPVRREPASEVPSRVHPTAEINPLQNCPPELTGLRVLLVDDEADSRDLLNLVLASCGASVTTAGSAAEAFELIEGERFDVIISDIGMPEEDGFSLVGRIRNLHDEQGGNIPAIALTAYARAEDRVQALRSGFQMHVAKPVEPSELVVAVANLAGRMRKPNRNESEKTL